VQLATPPDPGKPLPATPRGPTLVQLHPTAACDAGAGPGAVRTCRSTKRRTRRHRRSRSHQPTTTSSSCFHSCSIPITISSPDPVYANLDDAPSLLAPLSLQVQDYDPPSGITNDPPFVLVTTDGSLAVDEASTTADVASVVLQRSPVGAQRDRHLHRHRAAPIGRPARLRPGERWRDRRDEDG